MPKVCAKYIRWFESELDNISSVEKWVIQKKMNMNTSKILQDQTSIKEFLHTKKSHKFNKEPVISQNIYPVKNTRMQINHVIIVLFFPVQDK